MRRKLSLLLIVGGCACLVWSLVFVLESKMSVQRTMRLAEAAISVQPPSRNEPETIGNAPSYMANHDQTGTEPSQKRDPFKERAAFQPRKHEAFGVLRIPRLNAKLPIVEGTDDTALSKGVGHYETTAFPLDQEQILLSGHRDTVFRNFGKLAIGDRLIVDMPYGSFAYEIRETEIVDEDDTTVIRPMGEEVLTVTTCYPFRYIGNAPQRFVVYAYPVELLTEEERQTQLEIQAI